MPFKSQSQRAKFAELVEQGKMSKETFDEWNKETPEKLPDRIGPANKAKVSTVKKVKKI